jgi:alkylation response protein AidB-like acyl-CoA dehydrogenase
LLARLQASEAADAVADALAGRSIATVALHQPAGDRAGLVPAGAIADRVVVRRGSRLELVAVSEVNRHPIANLAADPLADVDVVAGVEIGAGAEHERAVDEWLVLTAARLVGSAHRAHRITCDYAVNRRTWDRVIGSYQGVSHPLADSATALDGARLLARKAAWAIDVRDQRASELAAMAFAFASETANAATYLAVHLHGGMGFTLEHDAQLHYRRVRGWARIWDEPRAAYLRVANERYGGDC